MSEAAQSRLPIRAVLDRASRSSNSHSEIREVMEEGLRFIVDLAHGQKGGLFLDQRENRRLVAERAQGLRVLNLFGYTGGFSLHAASAGARSTDTVDVAGAAIETARQNFELNHLSLADAGFHVSDAFEFLTNAIEREARWDIVICDPPSFAPNKQSLPAAYRAYRRLHELAATVTTPGGLLCAASCSSHVTENDFLASIEAGAQLAGRKWVQESFHGAAFDHPRLAAFPEGDYLKFSIGRCL